MNFLIFFWLTLKTLGNPILKFRLDKTFTLLQLTDLHLGNSQETNFKTLEAIKILI